MKTIINWRIFFILLAMSLLSVIAVFPYVLTLQGEVIKKTGLPVLIIFLLQFMQSAILFSIAIFTGLFLSGKINLHAPVLEAWTRNKDYKKMLRKIFPASFITGSITALIIYAADFLFTLEGAAITTAKNIAPVWQKLLAAFYGGITEEILMRLFLMSFFAWMGMKIAGKYLGERTIIIISILLAAVIFGLGHLPITASLTNITTLIIARAVVLNGIGGIVFGWLFWKKGLESAIIAHFSADIFLLTIFPLIFVY